MVFSTKVAAIEFEGDTVRVVVVKVGGGLPVILEMYETAAEYKEPDKRFEALAAAVDAAVVQVRTRPAAFVLCATTMYSVVRTLKIPFRGRRRVATAVPFELEPYLAFPIEDLLVDFTITGERSGETDVLAVGSRREMLDEQLAILAAAGVEAEAVGLDAAGLTALWLAGRKGLKGFNAILHVREQSAILAITNNKTLVYFRHIPRSAEQIRENPSCVVREIQNTLRGFLAERREEEAFHELFVTGIEFEEEARTSLSTALNVRVTDEVLLTRLKGHEAAMDEEGYVAADNVWEAAIGVAMGASGGPSAFDFKRFERDWRIAARGVTTHLMFSACLALLALVGWAYFCFQGTARNRIYAAELRQQIDSVNNEVAALQEQGLKDVPAPIMQLYRDPALVDLLMEFSEKMPNDQIFITEMRINSPGMGKTWLTVKGEANDVAALNTALEKLRQSERMRIEREPAVRIEDKATFEINIQRIDEVVANEQ